MISKFIIRIICLSFIILATPCPANDLQLQLTPEEKAWIDKDHTVRIRIGNAPPFMLTQGGIQGMAIDYLKHIFNKNGIKFQYVSEPEVTWPQALEYIKQHRIVDMVPTAKITEDRKKDMIFTHEYLFAPWVIFTRTDGGFVGSLEDLKGKTVSVEQGYVIHEKLMRDYPEINLKVVPANLENYTEIPIKDLSSGLVDAYIGNLLMTTYMIQTRGYTNIKVAAPTPFDNHNQAMAIRNDWPELVGIINKTLDSMTPEEISAIQNRWLSIHYEYGINKLQVFLWFLGGIGIAWLVIGIILFWNRRLKAEVEYRKRIEEAERQSKALYQTLVNTIPDLVWLKDLKGVYLSCNKTFELFFGAKESAIVSKTDYDFKSRKIADFFREHDRKAIAAGVPSINEEWLTFAANGYHGLFETIKTPMFDENGNPMGVLGIARDITDRKKAEEALRENELRYKKAQSIGHVGNWEYDIIKNKFWGSDEAKRIYGFAPDNKTFTVEEVERCIPERKRVHKALLDLINLDKPYDLEFEIQPMTGTETKNIRSMAEIIKNDSGKPSKITGVIQDITQQKKALVEKKKLESQLLHAQKIESIGTLAGGIAHDFNNILYPIIGFAEMSMDELPYGHPVRENIEDILQGAKRARDLVKQILLFSSQREVEKEPLLLKPLIQETLKLLRSTIPSYIEIQHDLYEDQDHVMANPTEIHEIIMNLCTNAYHAMEKTGGILKIGLNRSKPGPELNLPPEEYCCLSIGDTGPGIPDEIMNNIFDPYFTTKELGKGSGLGLSVIHGIVKNYIGGITVENKTEKGAVFKVYLPITSSIQKPLIVLPEEQKKQDGNEKILFVDDEETIVKLGIRLLERKGYKVTGKTNSLEALSLFESGPDDFDLVITDMSMPLMPGTEFAQKLLKIRPDLPIIVCSGFSEKIDHETAMQLGIKAYINKPVLAGDLFIKIRKVLDQSK